MQRRPIAQAQGQRAIIKGPALAADRGGRHATAVHEGGVEAAQAVVAGSHGHVGDRQRGFGQQLLGQQQAAGGMDLRRRRAQARHEQALQLARAQSQPGGQRGYGGVLQVAIVDQGQGALQRFVAEGVLGLRRQFRAAAQAGTEPGRRGRRSGGVVVHVARLRRGRRTHGPAVDAGTAHGGEEHPVEAGIAGEAGAFAGGVVQGQGGVHGAQSMPGRGARLAIFGQQCDGRSRWFRAGSRADGRAH